MYSYLATDVSETTTLDRCRSKMKYFNYLPPLSALKLGLCHSMPFVYRNIHVISDGLTAVAPHFLLSIWPHASAWRMRQADLCSVPTKPKVSTLAHSRTLLLCHHVDFSPPHFPVPSNTIMILK